MGGCSGEVVLEGANSLLQAQQRWLLRAAPQPVLVTPTLPNIPQVLLLKAEELSPARFLLPRGTACSSPSSPCSTIPPGCCSHLSCQPCAAAWAGSAVPPPRSLGPSMAVPRQGGGPALLVLTRFLLVPPELLFSVSVCPRVSDVPAPADG